MVDTIIDASFAVGSSCFFAQLLLFFYRKAVGRLKRTMAAVKVSAVDWIGTRRGLARYLA